ncbi:phosphoadenosine phosphosulfate reductase [Oceanicola sp. 22II-s10i]|uniref:phosphoadenosine phosphosulfate reductase n=1 Tax=Oceanicola sp. 22II-s10i TaxID=1317116 RepID=UPI000B51ECB7|nr:phosphoadenosine phosphosulfate reductase [Oceanicola sp. 22II-s10i]OWU84755.1 phosphoadenosine phosphosulfate reductase [Oceanicola sp. 22II-s10i]
MNEVEEALAKGLSEYGEADWLHGLVEIAEEHGYFQPLGKRHFAALVENGNKTLFVSFETLPGMRTEGEPFGWRFVREQGWSHLCLASDGDTWFRDPKVYGYFDRLVDDGFLEDFEKVIFYGAGPCGYAAAAFSVAAPGATVIAISPQASLDPEVSIWDGRFTHMRRTSFSDRYGFAPDMVDAADRMFLIYDPAETEDAMHAALFRRRHVRLLPMRRMGPAIEGELKEMQVLGRIIELAGADRLTRAAFARLSRTRRSHPPYLRRLMAAAEAADRPILAAAVCRNVVKRMKAPRFARKLEGLEAAAEQRRADLALMRKAVETA